MNTPPSIPNVEPAWQTYLRAILFLTPALIAWMFTNVLILPVLKDVWNKVGMANSGPRWFMDSADFFINDGRLIILAMILLFFALEHYLTAWPHYRRFVLSTVALIFNTVVLIGMATVCALATAAAHLLIERQ